MPLFGKSPLSKPPAPWSRPSAPSSKSSWGLFESLGLKSTPKKEELAQPKPPGLFGTKGYSSFKEQKEFARRAPYEPLPGTGQKLTREERVRMIEDLEKRSGAAGQPYGLSEQAWKGRVRPQMEREIYQLRIKGEINRALALERQIQQYEKWAKGS